MEVPRPFSTRGWGPTVNWNFRNTDFNWNFRKTIFFVLSLANDFAKYGELMMTSAAIKSKSFMAWALGLSLGLVLPQLCFGSTIEIEFTGVDISYNGTEIVDSDPFSADPDPLTSVVITMGDTLAGPVITDFISQNLYIPAVSAIPQTGGSTQSGAGGSLYLELGTGNHLDLTLGEVDISYIDFHGTLQFVFAATVGGVSAQDLPYGLQIGQKLGVSFSTQVAAGSLTKSNGSVSGFTAAGTGEVEGPAVPEPTGFVLLMLVIAGACSLRHRRK